MSRLPERDLHPIAANWLSKALLRVVGDPKKSQQGLQLSPHRGHQPAAFAARHARDYALCKWALEFQENHPVTAVESIAQIFALELKPDGKTINRKFVAQLHGIDIEDESAIVEPIIAGDVIIGIKIRRPVSADDLLKSYDSLGADSSRIREIISEFLNAMNMT
ncbi:hypothetical protein OAS69_01265 [Pseudomonadales bacterium]|nr:hypothetical protein [Pseudomonadales bacterium]